jgi:hypothetical protein
VAVDLLAELGEDLAAALLGLVAVAMNDSASTGSPLMRMSP